MSSWRDATSEEAQLDLDGLLDLAMPFAQQQLAKHGEFLPYGAVVSSNGEQRLIAVQMPDEHPASQDVLDGLLGTVRAEADDLRAVALVADVRIEGGDAIRIELEHREGAAMAVFLPYAKKRFGAPRYGDLQGGVVDRRVWGD